MALNDVLGQLVIDPTFSPADQTSITNSITQLYNGSATARGVLDKTVSLDRTLAINNVPDTIASPNPLPSFEIRIDLNLIAQVAYISPTGISIQAGQDLTIMHEIVHAVEGLSDRPRDTNTNSDGPTVRFTNQIRRELGIPERLSYEGTFLDSVISPGTNYTNGNTIDVALLASGSKDTSSNSPGTRDLIIARQPGRDNFKTGDGDDYLYGREGDDLFTGGGGNDFIDGGADNDLARYSGNCNEYTLMENADGTFTISDNRSNSPDGIDILRDVEEAMFTDGRISLQGELVCPGTDVVLAIDVSGSMSDDIAAVKASSNQIVEELFGTDDAPVASRLGIITFNDTGEIRTVLNFTDQDDISDRKAAALAGIDSIGIIGGGEEPLNGALLSALNGDAGSWSEGSTNNRIVVFSDEPPADPELRPQVVSLAANTNISLEAQATGNIATEGGFFDFTDEPFVDDTGAVPVEVFPILVGNDLNARDDFQSLADDTGGTLFTAADSTEIVDAVIGAIESPGGGEDNNQPPTTVDDSVTTNEAEITNIDILVNDSDPEGDAISVSQLNGNDVIANEILTLDSGAIINLLADSTLDYNPNGQFDFLAAGETATDTFSYSVQDRALHNE